MDNNDLRTLLNLAQQAHEALTAFVEALEDELPFALPAEVEQYLLDHAEDLPDEQRADRDEFWQSTPWDDRWAQWGGL